MTSAVDSYSEIDFKDFLEHHGIKGMKWGVRRTAAQLGKAASNTGKAVKAVGNAGKTTISAVKKANATVKDFKSYQANKKASKAEPSEAPNVSPKQDRKSAVKNRRELSDKELQDRINRIDKEKRLKDLTESDVSPAKHAVKNFMKGPGKEIGTSVIKKVAIKAGTGVATYLIYTKLSGTKFNPKEAAKFVVQDPDTKKKASKAEAAASVTSDILKRAGAAKAASMPSYRQSSYPTSSRSTSKEVALRKKK